MGCILPATVKPKLVFYLSVLQEPSSIEKVAEIDEHIGCAMSGLTADAKTLVDHARADTQVWHLLNWLVCVFQKHKHAPTLPYLLI